METENYKNRNYFSYIAILIWLIFMIIALIVILSPKLELGDSVISSKEPIPIELGIINIDGSNLYLFDETRKNIMVYDEEGNSIANYNFTFSGSVRVVELNETEEFLVVYYYRIHKFYKISFSGEVIDIRDNDNGYIDEYLVIDDEYQNYKLENNLLRYSVYNDEVLIYTKFSLLPIIILGAILFFIGMGLSVKNIRKYKQINKSIE